MPSLPAWLLPVLGSAFALGFYDLCKKHAVNRNSVMHVLFFATLCGSAFYLIATLLWTGSFDDARCSGRDFALIVLKSMLVSSSWTCVYYAMRDLPISIAAPIRASSPVWTFLGGLLLFHEVPTLLQGVAMLLIFTGYYLFSVLGKLEGISFRRAREVHLILLGTILGAASALYDKYPPHPAAHRSVLVLRRPRLHPRRGLPGPREMLRQKTQVRLALDDPPHGRPAHPRRFPVFPRGRHAGHQDLHRLAGAPVQLHRVVHGGRVVFPRRPCEKESVRAGADPARRGHPRPREMIR